MKYITIPGLEKPVSNLAIGSMVFSPERLPLTFALLDAFVELGGTLIDTAHRYRARIRGRQERESYRRLASRAGRRAREGGHPRQGMPPVREQRAAREPGGAA